MQMRKTCNGELISALGFGAMRLPQQDMQDIHNRI